MRSALLASVTLIATAASTQAAQHTYYIGVDAMPTLTSGAYAGLPNPNAGRLTFLYAHWDDVSPTVNHYHSKSTRIYTGPNPGAATATRTSPSNYVPEAAYPPIKLQPGTGLYAGKLVTAPYDVGGEPYHWADTTLGNTKSLSTATAGSPEHFMFNSSGGRWTGVFDSADLHWELVSLTPGLNVGDATTLNLLSAPGDDIHLGDGDESFEFTPVLWVDSSAPDGVYTATFRVSDLSGTYGSTGDVEIRTIVPEPATLSLVAGTIAFVARRRR